MTPWPSTALKRASVSSFGFGGTNVHVIMEEFRKSSDPQTPARATPIGKSHVMNGAVPSGIGDNSSKPEGTLSNGIGHHAEGFNTRTEREVLPTCTELGSSHRRLFLLTASDKDCVKTQMQDLSQYLQTKLNEEESFLADLAFTLAERRSMLDWRLAASASSTQELQAALESNDVHLNRASKIPGLAFIFTGQGAQWPAMGQQLMVHPVFTSTLTEADGCLRSLGATWSLLGGSW